MNPAPSVPLHLRAIRAALRRLNSYFSRRYESAAARPVPFTQAAAEVAEADSQLRQLDLSGIAAHTYFEKHLPRLARTLALVPRPRTTGRILEMGCYMQITPFLHRYLGYSEVRGAYHGLLGQVDYKTASVRGERFEIAVDLFDAEHDRFPYCDEYFETVLLCEVIEHLLSDPIHMLLECRRVLEEGGRVLVTTPNVAGLTSVARTLHGYDNPQIFSKYRRPSPGLPEEPPHVREYTAFELQAALQASGFEIESVFTEPIPELSINLPMWNFLEEHGYNTSMRGEQTYCVAVKRSELPVTRYPTFLYAD